MLSVLAYNIYKGKNLNQIITWLDNLAVQFDIICFQEFPKTQMRLLKENKRYFNYQFHYATSFIKNKSDFGELTVVYKKKLSVIDANIITLGHSFIEKRVIGIRRERTSLITRLRYNNKIILLANAHLAAYTINAKRRKQLLKIIEFINTDNKNEGISSIILGDFNYTSLFKQEKFLKFIKNTGFLNAHKDVTHNLFSLTFHQLDYILYKNCMISDIQIQHMPFSDHFPTIFKLNL